MPSSLRVTGCSFLRLGCRDDQHELFSASYARSNKKRNAKLLRCFPHCCPNHIERSYCGSSLHMLVTFQSDEDAATANRNEDLVVCARFEAAADVALPGVGNGVTPLPLESITALPSCALRVGRSSVESDWVLGEKATEIYQQQQFPKNTILYLFNNCRNPQWYYGYDSGSTKAHRELKHVLAAYIFQLYRHPEHQAQQNSESGSGSLKPAARLATVAVRHASPSFTIISYRRLNDTHRFKKQIEKEQHTPSAAVKPKPDVIIPRKTTSQQTNTDSCSQQGVRDIDGTNFMQLQTQSVDENVDGLEDKRSIPTGAPTLGLPPPQPPHHCPICSSPLSHRSHNLRHHSLSKTVEDLQLLLVLQNFMSFIPLDAFTFHFGRMDFRIQRQWLAPLSPLARARRHGTAIRSTPFELIASLASKFSLAQFVTDVVQPDIVVDDPVREQRVLQLCADLLLDVFVSSRIQQIFNQVCVGQGAATEGTAPSYGACERFSQLAVELIEELTVLLRAQTSRNDERTEDPITIVSLVDEVLSLIYGETKYQSLREKTSSLLLRRDESLEVAVQALYQGFLAEQQEPQTQMGVPKGSLGMGSPRSVLLPANSAGGKDGHNNLRLSSGVWNCRWFVEPLSISILPLFETSISESSTSFFWPSLLSVVTLLRLFASVDIVIESPRLTVVTAMTEDSSGTELVLDGEPHTLDTFPNGLSSLAGVALLGESWDMYQYQGYISDDGSSIELLIFSLPTSFSRRIPSSYSTVQETKIVLEARRFHLLLELDETRGRDEKGFFAVMEVSSASVDWNGPNHPLTDGIFDGIATWSPTMEVHATYIGVKLPPLAG